MGEKQQGRFPSARVGLVRQSSMKKPNSSRSLLRKSVSFDEIPMMQAIEHVKTIPKREMKRRWMSAKDFQKIQDENAATLTYLEQTKQKVPHDSQEWSTRGLERFTEQGMHQYRDNYRDAVTAVLHQQDLIWRSSTSLDDEALSRIANVYRRETQLSQQEAAQIAAQDEQEADEYLADCTLERIRKEQQKRDEKGLVKRWLGEPAKKLTRSLSFKSVVTPGA